MTSFNTYQKNPLGQFGVLATMFATISPVSQDVNTPAPMPQICTYSIKGSGSSATQQHYSQNLASSIFAPSTNDAVFLQQTLSEINQMRELQDDWDSYGSQKPSALALDIIESLAKKLSVFPIRPNTKIGSNAEAGLYWKSERGYVDVSVDADKKFVIYHADSALDPISYYEGHDFNEAVLLLSNKATSI